MAKVMKSKKGNFFILNQLLGKIPEEKFTENAIRIANFFRAVKKVLRTDLDEISDLQKEKAKKTEIEQKEINTFMMRLFALEKQAEKSSEELSEQTGLQSRFSILEAIAAEKAAPEIARIREIQEVMNSDDEKNQVEAKFDNEEFNFIEDVLKKSAGVLFKTDDGKGFDVEVMDNIFSMFENATNPDA